MGNWIAAILAMAALIASLVTLTLIVMSFG